MGLIVGMICVCGRWSAVERDYGAEKATEEGGVGGCDDGEWDGVYICWSQKVRTVRRGG